MSYDRAYAYEHGGNEGRSTKMRNEVVPPELPWQRQAQLAATQAAMELAAMENAPIDHLANDSSPGFKHYNHDRTDSVAKHDSLPKTQYEHVFTTTQARPEPLQLAPPTNDNHTNLPIHESHPDPNEHLKFNKHPKGKKYPPIPRTGQEFHETISTHEQTFNLQREHGNFGASVSYNSRLITPDAPAIDPRDVKRTVSAIMEDTPHDLMDTEQEYYRAEKIRDHQKWRTDKEKVKDEHWWNEASGFLIWGGLFIAFFGVVFGMGKIAQILTLSSAANTLVSSAANIGVAL